VYEKKKGREEKEGKKRIRSSDGNCE